MSEDAQADPQSEEKPAEPADDPGAEQSPDAEAKSAEEDLKQDSDQFQQHAQNINNFFGDATIGSGGTGTRRATGNITVAELAVRLTHFVPPEPFDKAKRILSEQHVVVLCGPGGIGKPTGALALAAGVAGGDKPVTRLAPSYSLAGLVEYQHYKPGRAYLLQDWTVGTLSTATQNFDVDLLQRKLRKVGAFLVITTGTGASSHRSLAELVVRWAPPDPLDLFNELLPTVTVRLAADQRATVMERVGRLRRPEDVVVLVRRLDRGIDVAFDALGDTDRARVADWFSHEPEARSLLSVAATCFLNETPEPVFQRHLARLVQLVEEHNPGATAVVPGIEAAGGRPAFPQRGSSNADSLDEVVRGAGDSEAGTGDRIRRFTSPRFREFAIAELAERYGFELWAPLREWINELAALPASATQVRLALGMALYAKHSPDDVQFSYLDNWASGDLSERLTAAYLLSWMCIDSALAATALRTAVSWVEDVGQRRAVTAALAFGGQLGLMFPSEALSWLWYLAMRGEAVSRVARRSMGELCCASVSDSASAATVVHYLHQALRRLIDEGAGRPAHGRFGRHLRKATSTVLDVLIARPLGSTESVTALILRMLPEHAERLGELWAEVLRSWPHRGTALHELITMMDVMRADDASLRAVGRFGTAVRRGMTDEEIRLLRDDIHGRLSGLAAPAAPLASALLAALGRTTNK